MVFDSGEVPEAQPLPTMLQCEENDGFPPLVTGAFAVQAGREGQRLLALLLQPVLPQLLPFYSPAAVINLMLFLQLSYECLSLRETHSAVVPVLGSKACLCAECISVLDSHFDVVPESREMGILAWLWK